jgi:hypothetical protein
MSLLVCVWGGGGGLDVLLSKSLKGVRFSIAAENLEYRAESLERRQRKF